MKNLITILLAFVIVSCQSKKEDVTNELEQKAMSMFEAFNKHDWQAMAAHYVDPALFLDPSLGKDYVSMSRAETVKKYTAMSSVFPDLHDEVVGMYPSGDKVIVEFVSTGTGPDGSKFNIPIVAVLTFKDGLIVKDATYYDN